MNKVEQIKSEVIDLVELPKPIQTMDYTDNVLERLCKEVDDVLNPWKCC